MSFANGTAGSIYPFAAALMLVSGGAVYAASLNSRSATNADRPGASEARRNALHEYGRLPLGFEENRGQTDKRVKYLARAGGYSVYLTDSAAILALRGSGASGDIRMDLVGAQRTRPVAGSAPLPGHANYFIGQDPTLWLHDVPTFARVRYGEVYPGVDLVYYGSEGHLEYDFVVAPGADPNAIGLKFAGAEQLALTSKGDLSIAVSGGRVTFLKPAMYQMENRRRRRITGRFILRAGHEVAFSLGPYDRSEPLIIDPSLAYSTYLGGEGNDSANGIAVDRAGNAYVVGNTESADFPVTQGAYDTQYKNPDQIFVTFVAKLNPSGTALLYATYLGSGACDSQPFLDNGLSETPANGIAVDRDGNAYIAGSVCSGKFPVTSGAFQTTIAPGGAPAYVAKLNPTGSELVYATYLGGSGGDRATALAVNAAGHAFITGYTGSTDFPVTRGAFQTDNRAATGMTTNAFVTKLSPTGSSLVYSTYLGGSGLNGEGDVANALALDGDDNAYVAGVTFSADFPVTKGTFQAHNRSITSERVGSNSFITKLNAAGTALEYSSYLGGSGGPGGASGDAAYSVAVDGAGHAFVAGSAVSADFPVTPGAFQTTNKAAGLGQYPGNNGFITKFGPTGAALVYSTFLGGSGNGQFSDGAGGDAVNGIVVDRGGHAYVAGITISADFPVTDGAFQTVNRTFKRGTSGFVSELSASGSALVASTYLSGSLQDYANAVSIDATGSVYVSGLAASADYPVSQTAVGATNSGSNDAFITKLNVHTRTSPTETELESSANPQIGGKPVTFTATVARAASASEGDATSLPTGSVEFIFVDPASNEVLDNVDVPLDSTGRARYTISTLALGSHSVVASYAILGAGLGPSSSPILTEVIKKAKKSED